MYRLRRFVYQPLRLTMAMCIGIGVVFVLPAGWPWITQSLVAWNMAVWFYLILMMWVMLKSSQARVCKIAKQEDRSRFAVLLIMSIAALASFAAIILELVSLKGLSLEMRLFHYAVTGATVLGSWFLIVILYTFHYAHLFYTAHETQPALIFPNQEPHPDYSGLPH